MMQTLINPRLSRQTTRYYFFAGVCEALAALLFLLLIPSDPKNAWLFGFSKTRLVMAFVMGLIVIVCLWLAVLARRDSHWTNRFNLNIQALVHKLGIFLPGIILTYALVFGGGFLSFLISLNTHNLTTRAGVLLRLLPFVLLGFTRALQAAMVIFILIYKWPKQKIEKNSAPAIRLTPQKITFILVSIALLLVLLSGMVDLMEQYTWNLTMLGFRQKVDIDREANLPTFFSTVILLLAAALLSVIGSIKQARGEAYRYHWSILALIFLFFAIDEASVLHERMGQLLGSVLQLQGVFYYGWVVFGLAFVFILGIMFLKFFLDLPKIYKMRFITAIGIFFLGAIGFEMLTGWYTDTYKMLPLIDTVLTTLEETLEMGGVILFIHFLMIYIRDNYPQIQFSITDSNFEIE